MISNKKLRDKMRKVVVDTLGYNYKSKVDIFPRGGKRKSIYFTVNVPGNSPAIIEQDKKSLSSNLDKLCSEFMEKGKFTLKVLVKQTKHRKSNVSLTLREGRRQSRRNKNER